MRTKSQTYNMRAKLARERQRQRRQAARIKKEQETSQNQTITGQIRRDLGKCAASMFGPQEINCESSRETEERRGTNSDVTHIKEEPGIQCKFKDVLHHVIDDALLKPHGTSSVERPPQESFTETTSAAKPTTPIIHVIRPIGDEADNIDSRDLEMDTADYKVYLNPGYRSDTSSSGDEENHRSSSPTRVEIKPEPVEDETSTHINPDLLVAPSCDSGETLALPTPKSCGSTHDYLQQNAHTLRLAVMDQSHARTDCQPRSSHELRVHSTKTTRVLSKEVDLNMERRPTVGRRCTSRSTKGRSQTMHTAQEISVDDGFQESHEEGSNMTMEERSLWAYNTFQKWNEMRNNKSSVTDKLQILLERTSKSNMNKYISMFIREVRKPDGSRYSPSGLKNLFYGLRDSLISKAKGLDILTSKQFKNASLILGVELRKIKERKPDPSTRDDVCTVIPSRLKIVKTKPVIDRKSGQDQIHGKRQAKNRKREKFDVVEVDEQVSKVPDKYDFPTVTEENSLKTRDEFDFSSGEEEHTEIKPRVRTAVKEKGAFSISDGRQASAYSAFQIWNKTRNMKSSVTDKLLTPLDRSSIDDMNKYISLFIREVRKPDMSRYSPKDLFNLYLGLRESLKSSGSGVDILNSPQFKTTRNALEKEMRKLGEQDE